MNGKTVTTSLLVCAVALVALLGSGNAAPESSSASKIGIVSIRYVFTNSKKYAQRRAQLLAQQSKARAQLEDLAKELEVEEAGLKALKSGTQDHLQQMKLVLDKRASLDSQQEYLKQQRSLEEKQWVESLYQDTLKAVNELARAKGLDLVLERTEPEFPIASEELMALSMHKVLYSAGCVDLTAEVLARVDAEPVGTP